MLASVLGATTVTSCNEDHPLELHKGHKIWLKHIYNTLVDIIKQALPRLALATSRIRAGKIAKRRTPAVGVTDPNEFTADGLNGFCPATGNSAIPVHPGTSTHSAPAPYPPVVPPPHVQHADEAGDCTVPIPDKEQSLLRSSDHLSVSPSVQCTATGPSPGVLIRRILFVMHVLL